MVVISLCSRWALLKYTSAVIIWNLTVTQNSFLLIVVIGQKKINKANLYIFLLFIISIGRFCKGRRRSLYWFR